MNTAKHLSILSICSILLYAFTGIGFWSMLPPDGVGFFRGLLLVIIHLAPFVAWLFQVDTK